MNRPMPRIPRMIAAALAVALIATVFATAAPAFAGTVQSPKYFDRKGAVRSAAEWTNAHVPYSQTDWRGGYRTDCSGLISKAWHLDQSYVTWSLPQIAKRISKGDLQPGDIILNTERHVILFAGWADKSKTSYIAYEQVGGQYHQGTRRVVSYPYDTPTRMDYKPYRYVGGHSLDAPANKLPRPLMQTYAGGAPLVPGPQAAAMNAATKRIAAKREAVAKAKALAVKRARKAAVEKKAARLAARRAAAARAAAEAARRAPLTAALISPATPAHDSIVTVILHSLMTTIGF